MYKILSKSGFSARFPCQSNIYNIKNLLEKEKTYTQKKKTQRTLINFIFYKMRLVKFITYIKYVE